MYIVYSFNMIVFKVYEIHFAHFIRNTIVPLPMFKNSNIKLMSRFYVALKYFKFPLKILFFFWLWIERSLGDFVNILTITSDQNWLIFTNWKNILKWSYTKNLISDFQGFKSYEILILEKSNVWTKWNKSYLFKNYLTISQYFDSEEYLILSGMSEVC